MNDNNNNNKNVWLRILGIIFLPCIMIFLEAKRKESVVKSLIVAMAGFVVFTLFWGMVFGFSNSDLITSLNNEIKGKNEIIKKQENTIQKSKETPTPTKTPTKTSASTKVPTPTKKPITKETPTKAVVKDIVLEMQLEILRKSFKDSSNIEYREDEKMVRIIPKQPTFMIEAEQAREGSVEALTAWKLIIENLKKISLNFADKEIQIGIVNNLNEENYIVIVQNGKVLYDYMNME